MCLWDLEMGLNIVCTLKINGKRDLLTVFSSRGKIQNATKPLMRMKSLMTFPNQFL